MPGPPPVSASDQVEGLDRELQQHDHTAMKIGAIVGRIDLAVDAEACRRRRSARP